MEVFFKAEALQKAFKEFHQMLKGTAEVETSLRPFHKPLLCPRRVLSNVYGFVTSEIILNQN
jgi:hypothetical protein